MPDINKKEAFKLAIREFHERSLPDLVERKLSVPLDAEKVVTLYGPRRVGKTYYLYQLINSLIPLHGKERIIFINLEDERLLPLDVKDMRLLVEAYYELYPRARGGRSCRKCLALFYSLIIIGYAKISKIRCPPGAPEGEADGGQAPGVLRHVIGWGIEKRKIFRS